MRCAPVFRRPWRNTACATGSALLQSGEELLQRDGGVPSGVVLDGVGERVELDVDEAAGERVDELRHGVGAAVRLGAGDLALASLMTTQGPPTTCAWQSCSTLPRSERQPRPRPRPGVATLVTTLLPSSAELLIGREHQSMAFLSTPGMDPLYSGLAMTSPSASEMAVRSLRTASGPPSLVSRSWL